MSADWELMTEDLSKFARGERLPSNSKEKNAGLAGRVEVSSTKDSVSMLGFSGISSAEYVEESASCVEGEAEITKGSMRAAGKTFPPDFAFPSPPFKNETNRDVELFLTSVGFRSIS